MITVRTAEGKVKRLWAVPPLRLRARTTNNSPDETPSSLFAATPDEVVRCILAFLPLESRDGTSADSTCRAWRRAALPLWGGVASRTDAVRRLAARDRVARAWRTLEAFVDRDVRSSLNGPVREEDAALLAEAVRPWRLPVDLLASLRIHDGEWRRGHGRGMVAGARLLAAREMVEGMRRWRGAATSACDRGDDSARTSGVLKVPLFSETGARQIAVELSSRVDDVAEAENDGVHGRIVVVSPSAPYAVHYRVEASCWERFLTLV